LLLVAAEFTEDYYGHLPSNLPFRLHPGFHWRDFLESTYILHAAHALRTLRVWLRSVSN